MVLRFRSTMTMMPICTIIVIRRKRDQLPELPQHIWGLPIQFPPLIGKKR
jgi:hypothetical protein